MPQRISTVLGVTADDLWAWLVVNGYKDIENRSCRTNHRGPLLIDASWPRQRSKPMCIA